MVRQNSIGVNDAPPAPHLGPAIERAKAEIEARRRHPGHAAVVRRAEQGGGHDEAARRELAVAELEEENLRLRHTLADLEDVIGGPL